MWAQLSVRLLAYICPFDLGVLSCSAGAFIFGCCGCESVGGKKIERNESGNCGGST